MPLSVNALAKKRDTCNRNTESIHTQKRDLGRHAYENRMPEWLYRMLEEREKQNLQDAPPGILDVLHKLLEHEQNVESAYLCSSDLWYIGKIKFKGKDEGNDFCGYRNIQMLFSYLIATKRQGLGHLQENVPTIFDIQDMIEDAWVQGFNESGRVQTGGIKATRKHIGTPEVCVLSFNSLLLWDSLVVSLIR